MQAEKGLISKIILHQFTVHYTNDQVAVCVTKGVIFEEFEQSYKENLGSTSANFLLLKNLFCRIALHCEIFVFGTCDGWSTSNARQV